MKLYELTEIYRNIEEIMSDTDADIETLEKALLEVKDNVESKAENISKLVKNIDGDIEVLKAEEKRLAERRRTLENKQKNIKKYLELQLKAMKIDKVKTPLFTVAIQNNPPSVNILDETLIPEEFKKTTTTVVKKDLLAVLKEGRKIEGAEIKQTRSLRIR